MMTLALRAIYAAVLLATSWTDIRERRIPNRIVYPAILLALLAMFVIPGWPTALGGGLLMGGIFTLAALFFRGGVGDMKLAVFTGLILGFPLVLEALAVAFLVSAAVALAGLLTGRYTRRSFLPFAPFLAIGTLVTWLYPLALL